MGETREPRIEDNEPREDKESQKDKQQKPKETKMVKAGRAILFAGGLAAGAVAAGEGSEELKMHMREANRPKYNKVVEDSLERSKSLDSNIDQEADPEAWADAIRGAMERADFPPTIENLAVVLTLISAESGYREYPRAVGNPLSPTEAQVGEVKEMVEGKAPETGGPMEVHVKHVMESEGVSAEEAMKLLSTIEGGLRYGIAIIKDLMDEYQDYDLEQKLLSVFADYNTGRYASRNAGFQNGLNQVDGIDVREDGVCGPITEGAIQQFLREKGITIDPGQIKVDLEKHKESGFKNTPTWKAVEEALGKKIEPVPADSPITGWWGLKAVANDALEGFKNSREYAALRLKEYKWLVSLVEQESENQAKQANADDSRPEEAKQG